MQNIDKMELSPKLQVSTDWKWDLNGKLMRGPSEIGSQHKDSQSSKAPQCNYPLFQSCQPNLSLDPSNSCRQEQSLALENMNNSLALLTRQSMERVDHIPRAMLSNCQDVFQPQYEQYHQNDYELKYQERSEQLFPSESINSVKQPLIPLPKFSNAKIQQLHAQDAKLLVDSLGLEKLLPLKKENTKNVLRNFGNAQNQYALYHRHARQIIQQELHDPTKFDSWIRTLKLQNFQHFKKVWQDGGVRPYIRLYKRICWKFYTEQAIPYVLSSRMKNSQTKMSHLKYIYRFLEGIQDPTTFNYFKKQQK